MLPSVVVLHVVFVMQVGFLGPYLVVGEGVGEVISFDKEKGLFGWASEEYIWLSLTVVGPIA